MSSTPNGLGGLELEKFPDALPTIEVSAPANKSADTPDAGLRSLDHCKHSQSCRVATGLSCVPEQLCRLSAIFYVPQLSANAQ